MKFVLGAAQFGLPYGIANQRKVTKSEVSDIIKLAKNYDIRIIDSAINYGNSEEVIGSLTDDYWKIISKLPEIGVCSSDIYLWIRHQVNNSLKRLNKPYLYGLLLHRPQQLLCSSKGAYIYNSLLRLKHEGVVKKIGISVYEPNDLGLLLQNRKFDIVQCPCNALDRRLETSGWAEKLKSKGIEIHGRSIFLQGLLLQKKEFQLNKFPAWQFLWDKWHETIKYQGISALEACVGFVCSKDYLDKIIIGINSVEQLKEIFFARSSVINLDAMPGTCDKKILHPNLW